MGAPTKGGGRCLLVACDDDHGRSRWRTRSAGAGRFLLRRQLVCLAAALPVLSLRIPAPPLAQRCRRRCFGRSDTCYGCNENCDESCNEDCNDSCDGSCDGFFGGDCDYCDHGCDSACDSSCDGSCDSSCNGACDSLCNSGCSCSSGEYGAAEQVTCGPRAVAQPPNTHPTPVHRAPASTPRIPARRQRIGVQQRWFSYEWVLHVHQ